MIGGKYGYKTNGIFNNNITCIFGHKIIVKGKAIYQHNFGLICKGVILTQG